MLLGYISDHAQFSESCSAAASASALVSEAAPSECAPVIERPCTTATFASASASALGTKAALEPVAVIESNATTAASASASALDESNTALQPVPVIENKSTAAASASDVLIMEEHSADFISNIDDLLVALLRSCVIRTVCFIYFFIFFNINKTLFSGMVPILFKGIQSII